MEVSIVDDAMPLKSASSSLEVRRFADQFFWVDSQHDESWPMP